MVTQAGIDLISTINEELLKSAKLTGLWENKLRQIERGSYSAPEFIDELKEMMRKIVNNVLSDNSMRKIEVEDDKSESGKKGNDNATEEKPKKTPAKRKPAVKSLEEIMCPVCGKGHLLKGKTAYGCSCFREGCTLRLPFEEYPAELTPAKLAAAVKKAFKTTAKKV